MKLNNENINDEVKRRSIKELFDELFTSYDQLTYEEKEMAQEVDYDFVRSEIEDGIGELYDYVLINNKPTFENIAKLNFVFFMIIALIQDGLKFILIDEKISASKRSESGNGDLSLDELKKYAKELSIKHWGVEYDGDIKLVNREWKSRNACIRFRLVGQDVDVHDRKNYTYTIIFSRKRNQQRTKKEVLDDLLHELVHWRLFVTGKPYDDGDEEFVAECLRVGASLSGTKKAQKALEKFKNKR